MDKLVEKLDVGDGITSTPAIKSITGTQSLRDTLALMKRSRNFFQ